MTNHPPTTEPAASRRLRLRRTMKLHRQNLAPQQRMAAAQGLRRVLESVPAFIQARDIGGYWACHGEVPLNLLLTGIQQRGQHYWLPRVLPRRQLEFARWGTGEAVVANRYGIPEAAADAPTRMPQETDILLLPLLAFDGSGNRLGTGGGYYDTSLAFLRAARRPARPLLIGIGYAFQQVEQIDAMDWDVPLDMVATEQELIDCTLKRSDK